MHVEDLFKKYGEPFHVGSKHLVWKDVEENKAIKMTRPGHFNAGTIIVTSQPWREPADPSSPHPSLAEISEYMEAYGFKRRDSKTWERSDGVLARNVRPKDFIKTKEGVFVIDINLVDPKS